MAQVGRDNNPCTAYNSCTSISLNPKTVEFLNTCKTMPVFDGRLAPIDIACSHI